MKGSIYSVDLYTHSIATERANRPKCYQILDTFRKPARKQYCQTVLMIHISTHMADKNQMSLMQKLMTSEKNQT